MGKWPNTYTMTKCIAEDLLREKSQGLPLTIVRPGIGLFLTLKDINSSHNYRYYIFH